MDASPSFTLHLILPPSLYALFCFATAVLKQPSPPACGPMYTAARLCLCPARPTTLYLRCASLKRVPTSGPPPVVLHASAEADAMLGNAQLARHLRTQVIHSHGPLLPLPLPLHALCAGGRGRRALVVVPMDVLELAPLAAAAPARQVEVQAARHLGSSEPKGP